MTAGLRTILAARRIVLVVRGNAKRAILRQLLQDPVGPGLPGSWLRSVEGVTLLADDAAWPSDVAREPVFDGPRRAAPGHEREKGRAG